MSVCPGQKSTDAGSKRGLKEVSDKAGKANHTFTRGRTDLAEGPEGSRGSRVVARGLCGPWPPSLNKGRRGTGARPARGPSAARRKRLKERGVWCVCLCVCSAGKEVESWGRWYPTWECRASATDMMLPSPSLLDWGLRGRSESSSSLHSCACHKTGAR